MAEHGRGPGRFRGKLRQLSVLPTALTLGNGVCGMGSVGVTMSQTLPWDDETRLFFAGALIFAGMLFDLFDGHAARITGQESQFGAELDSLCDAITFGVAPAVILWDFCDVLPARITWAIGAVFTVCVVLRLARFNVETKEDDSHQTFEGLPSPAAAGTIASFAIALPELAGFLDDQFATRTQAIAGTTIHVAKYVLPVLTVVLAYLMVSRFEYPHFFQQFVGGKKRPYQIGQAVLAMGAIFIVRELAVPLIFCYFAFESPVRHMFARSFRRGREQPAHPPREKSAEAEHPRARRVRDTPRL